MNKLSTGKQIAYATGMMGWSIMTNIIIVMLPYFYLPPSNSGLTPLVPQLLVFGLFNILSLIAASGRLIDAFFDPYIGSVSDNLKNPKGKRLPLMKWAVLPSIIFCALVFYPLERSESLNNAWFLALMLAGFFITSTTYIIPYNALMAEITNTPEEKVKLSTYQQVGFVIGMILSALCNNYADLIQVFFHIPSRTDALQYAIICLCIFSGIVMIIPLIFLDERKLILNRVSEKIDLIPAIKATFRNRNFKYYLISDFAYYTGLSIMTSGLLFFVTVLLGLPDSEGAKFMGLMVLLSLFFYPVVGYGSKKIGKKNLVLVAFGVLSLVFLTIYVLGKLPLTANVQMIILVVFASFPLAALGILPNAILADIAQKDTEETGKNHEGMFFAVKYLFVKLGQTLGIAIFAMLTIYGKDPGNDYGLRLNGVVGFILCLLAMFFFARFREDKAAKAMHKTAV